MLRILRSCNFHAGAMKVIRFSLGDILRSYGSCVLAGGYYRREAEDTCGTWRQNEDPTGSKRRTGSECPKTQKNHEVISDTDKIIKRSC